MLCLLYKTSENTEKAHHIILKHIFKCLVLCISLYIQFIIIITIKHYIYRALFMDLKAANHHNRRKFRILLDKDLSIIKIVANYSSVISALEFEFVLFPLVFLEIIPFIVALLK